MKPRSPATIRAMANLKGTPWTEQERLTLASVYPRGGIKAAMRVMPHRSERSLYRKAFDMGLGGTRRRRWTREDLADLRASWGEDDILRIARRLKRTKLTVYWKARELGLDCGAPEDWIYVSHAAEKSGYCLKSFWMILRWARVRVLESYGRNLGKRRRHIVDRYDVEDALARWHASETIASAARRLGMDPLTLSRWLQAADVEMRRTSDGRKAHVRVASKEVDRVIADRNRTLCQTETLAQACRRIGVCRQTLRAWLRAAGFERVGKFDRLDPNAVDAAVRAAAKVGPGRGRDKMRKIRQRIRKQRWRRHAESTVKEAA